MLVLKGLLYDLQESASNSKDQKDEMDEMVATIEALESELTFKSGELAAVVVNCQLLEAVFFHQMNDSIKKLSVDRGALSIQRDQLQGQVILLKESFEKIVQEVLIFAQWTKVLDIIGLLFGVLLAAFLYFQY
ncbi:hypothetical protein P8452_20095 [Trifolium repens]|nr:hypothetical protein P8452_20095 [Trifolium repens]